MTLSLLAEKFKSTPLYMVGGAVRNELLGVPAKDIDITASMRAEDVISLLQDSEFEVVPSSLRMGTLIIKDGENSYEYTSFRLDSYPLNSGVHTPCEVRFTDDINLDSLRRDFTVNAIYKNILTGEIVDPLGGCEDIKKRVLRTTRGPAQVFSEDGLRIMRLARFHAQLGFSIDDECFRVASSLSYLLRDISVERIEEELSKILVADVSGYGNEYGHYYGIWKLVEIGAMEYIIPELMRCKGVMQNPKYHDDDVLSHILNAFKVSDVSIRLATLLHDIGKPYELEKSGNMYMHNVSGSRIAHDVMKRLRYPNKVIDEVTRLVYIHMFDINGDAKVDTVKKFIVANHDLMDKFLLLRKADNSASLIDSGSREKIESIYKQMQDDNIPMKISDLAVNGKDLMALGYNGIEIGKTLDRILQDVALSKVKNQKDDIISYIRGGR